MPDNKCARCGVNEVRIFAKFYDRNELPEERTLLGFCSEICKSRFCAAIKALSMGV